MASLIFQSLYFFLPAYIANMAPVLFKWIPFLDTPIHEKLFGAHKTWRGIVVAALTGMLIFGLQKYLYIGGFQQWALIDYSDFSVWLGFCLGLGAILGDVVKSYYKRKAGICPGEKWIPFDQLDFVIGGIIGSWIFYVPSAGVVLIIMIVSPLLHILVTKCAYWLKIRKEKW
ncbi:MAG TPA: CDP-archaeol synthase [Candidatus Nanoarchaeia archaeon]|nr:CDP-archaeol synthase [Candidatus Nanoarchaeia archaeon]